MNQHFHHHGNEFEKLKPEQYHKLVEAVPLITLLIAGADGQYNMQETEWAAKITKIRSYANHASLGEYYEHVGMVFEERLKALMQELPSDPDQRKHEISERLDDLNEILPRLHPDFAARIYKDLRTFAKHVARSSGGFMGFGSISAKEAKLINLHMIDPIFQDEEEE